MIGRLGRALKPALRSGPGQRLLRARFGRGPVVLFYHGLCQAIDDPRVQMLQLTQDRFRREMTWLKRHYEVISLDDLAQGLASGGLHPGQAAVTFDDGFVGTSDLAAPVMADLGLPWAVFVNTAHLGTSRRLASYYLRALVFASGAERADLPSLGRVFDLGDETGRREVLKSARLALEGGPQEAVRGLVEEIMACLGAERWAELDARFASEGMMSWEQAAALASEGVIIGSHCHEHVILRDSQPREEVEHQLRRAKELIAERIPGAAPCRHFCYPRGTPADITPRTLELVAAAGYELGYTALPGEVHDLASPLLIPRLAPPGADLDDLGVFADVVNLAFRRQGEYRQGCARILGPNPA